MSDIEALDDSDIGGLRKELPQAERQRPTPYQYALVKRKITDEMRVASWDDEELERGCRRRRNGRFVDSAATAKLSELAQKELTRRRRERASDLLEKGSESAARYIVDTIDDNSAPSKVRLDAANLVLQRTLGKVPDKIDMVMVEAPWKAIIESATVVGTREQAIEVGETQNGVSDPAHPDIV